MSIWCVPAILGPAVLQHQHGLGHAQHSGHVGVVSAHVGNRYFEPVGALHSHRRNDCRGAHFHEAEFGILVDVLEQGGEPLGQQMKERLLVVRRCSR